MAGRSRIWPHPPRWRLRLSSIRPMAILLVCRRVRTGRSLEPRAPHLPRYGMAPEWARATRPLVVIFTGIGIPVTMAFSADVTRRRARMRPACWC